MRPTATGLLDTNTVILLGRLSDPASLPAHPEVCTITMAELSVGPHATSDPLEAARRQEQVQRAESAFDPIPFDQAAARAFGRVSASLRASGRKTSARAFDALIASVAIANELPLYTVNPSDFSGIDGLDVRAVAHPGVKRS